MLWKPLSKTREIELRRQYDTLKTGAILPLLRPTKEVIQKPLGINQPPPAEM